MADWVSFFKQPAGISMDALVVPAGATVLLLRMVAWWGVFLWHVGSVAARAGLVSNNVMRSV